MSVLQTVYSPAISNSPLRSTAERATQSLNELADLSSADSIAVLAEWDLARSGNGPALRLRLKKENDEITADFKPADLSGGDNWTEMSRAYRGLLDVRIRRLLDGLKPSDNEYATAEDDN